MRSIARPLICCGANPPPNGAKFTSAASATPGICRTRSSAALQNASRTSGALARGRCWQRDRHVQQPARVIAHVDAAGFHDRARQQRRQYQQHNRRRGLAADEHRAQKASRQPARCGGLVGLQRRNEIAAPAEARRRKAGDDADGDGQQSRQTHTRDHRARHRTLAVPESTRQTPAAPGWKRAARSRRRRCQSGRSRSGAAAPPGRDSPRVRGGCRFRAAGSRRWRGGGS